eukprot:14698739-Alexandrium_andersonii.AAC.1
MSASLVGSEMCIRDSLFYDTDTPWDMDDHQLGSMLHAHIPPYSPRTPPMHPRHLSLIHI